MGEQRDFDRFGDEVLKAFDRARESMDFTELGNTLKKSVNDAVDGIREYAGEVSRGVKDGLRDVQDAAEYGARRGAADFGSTIGRAVSEAADILRRQGRQESLPPALVNYHPEGGVAGILKIVFGGLGLGGFGVNALVFGILAATGVFTIPAFTLGMLIGGTAVSALVVKDGVDTRSRLARFRRYVGMLGSKTYAEVKQLSDRIGKPEAFVAADLQKMIEKKYFPKGQLSADEKYLLLDEKTAQQYSAAHDRQQEEIRRESAEKARANDPATRQLREAVAAGKDYIRRIREANDAIPGEEISRKLDRLEEITDKIFARVELRPELLPQLRKLMEYYLPMTMKLVNTYRDFDAQPVQGENIQKAKKEIEETLDTINDAFERLFDSLFADTALDISTDISVLQTLLAQEGLTGDEMKGNM